MTSSPPDNNKREGSADRPTRPTTGRPVTMIDVARAAGVSHATVSRVLNGRPHIKDETRRRVESAVASLGYVANLPARRLAGGRLGAIGLVVLDLESSYLAQIVRAVDASLADAGLDLMLCTTHRRERRENSYVAQLSVGLVDGLIVLLPRDVDRYATDLAARGFPFVLLDHGSSPLANSVSADHGNGTRQAMRHLAELGHRRIACVTGDLDIDAGRDRVAAYHAAVAEFDLVADHDLVIEGDFLESGGRQAAHMMLGLDPRPTAVFASSDTAAFGVLSALDERGVSVPGEISVVGFDDVPEAAMATPPLTTVRQPLAEMGRRAVQLLLEKIEEPDRTVSHVRLPVELVVRESTGPAPAV